MASGASEAGEATPTPGLVPGTVVADRYKVESLLGEGGMGAVYRAEHVHMRKAVALKVLHTDALEFPEVVARFEREAIAAAHIDHPNVVSATDFGKLPDGSFFLVLEYVDGEGLREILANGPLAPERALYVIREIAAALVVAHKSGVVHRDLKPENVMLVARSGPPGTPNEAVKVFDFGIAKIDVGSVTGKRGSTTMQPITRVGTIFGTPDYMAPEQAMGQPVDGRADLYALGVMLYEMLTGTRPFKGGAVTMMRQHILEEVPALPADLAARVDPRIGPILKKLLAKDANDRYADAGQLTNAIDDILGRAQSNPPASLSATSNSRPAEAPASPPPPVATPLVEKEKTWRPVAGPTAYSAEASNKRKRTAALIACALVGGMIAGGAALVSARSAAPSKPRHVASAPRSDSTAQPATAESGTAAAADITPTPAESAAEKTAADSTSSPTASTAVIASGSPAVSSAPPAKSSPGKSGRGRRKGPGGIYVPPPKDWIK